jgi:hypothetical protein
VRSAGSAAAVAAASMTPRIAAGTIIDEHAFVFVRNILYTPLNNDIPRLKLGVIPERNLSICAEMTAIFDDSVKEYSMKSVMSNNCTSQPALEEEGVLTKHLKRNYSYSLWSWLSWLLSHE